MLKKVSVSCLLPSINALHISKTTSKFGYMHVEFKRTWKRVSEWLFSCTWNEQSNEKTNECWKWIKQRKKKRMENTMICNWSDDERVDSLERPNTMPRQNEKKGKISHVFFTNVFFCFIPFNFFFYHFDPLLLLILFQHRMNFKRMKENRLIFAGTVFVCYKLYRIELILS